MPCAIRRYSNHFSLVQTILFKIAERWKTRGRFGLPVQSGPTMRGVAFQARMEFSESVGFGDAMDKLVDRHCLAKGRTLLQYLPVISAPLELPNLQSRLAPRVSLRICSHSSVCFSGRFRTYRMLDEDVGVGRFALATIQPFLVTYR